jgi:tRNA(Ile)-lysidine synthase
MEYLDFDRISLPLIARRRRTGDRFQPLGLTGSKKVGKFITAAKMPQKLRQTILILEDRKSIVWLCPLRMSEQAKVTSQTRRLLALRVIDTRVRGIAEKRVANKASSK